MRSDPERHAGEPGSPARTGGGAARRTVLGGGVVAGAGAVGAVAGAAVARTGAGASAPAAQPTGKETVPAHGAHQAGIETPPQAHASFSAFDLHRGTDRSAVSRLFSLLTDDIERLVSGRGPLTDADWELAGDPARLTVTVGVGPGLVRAAGATVPPWLRPLPAFGIDRLRPELCGGDLLLQICSDDPLTLAHAARVLQVTVRTFATPRWTVTGFRGARGARPEAQTQRNLFGQIDGTVNPRAGTPDFASVVWNSPGWLEGGTSLVLRRIAMDMDGWDELDRPAREQVIGRRLADGAPLTGRHERDQPDYDATDENGLHRIPEFAHIRRAVGVDEGGRERILRRPYNYRVAGAGSGEEEVGLLFASYQRDPLAQFVPIQRRLDRLDLLNQWTTPVGSSVFAILPGFQPGRMLGEALVS